MPRLAVVGHICIDLTPAITDAARLAPGRLIDVGPLAVSLGGCVANTARALSNLGLSSRIHATVGDDDLGRLVAAKLAEIDGVAGSPRITGGSSTSYSLVLEPAGADRTFWHHTGANDLFDGADVDMTGIDALHIGYPSLLPRMLDDDAELLLRLLRRARAAGVTTSIDLAVVDPDDTSRDWEAILRAVIAETDVISPSLDDLTSALGPSSAAGGDLAEFAARLLGWGAAVVAISDGSAGMLLRTADAARLTRAGRLLAPLAHAWADATVRMPPVAVETVVTTNGAGDALTAGLLFAIANESSPQVACSVATAAAAAIVSGAEPTVETIARLRPELAIGAAAGVGAAAVPTRPTGPRPRPTITLLQPNRPADRFYRGGSRIDEFRSHAEHAEYTPEDWVASTTSVRGEHATGQTRLPDGRLLREAIAEDPTGWLGADHVGSFGSDTMLLVKLLDAGQRLPIHAHPDREFARRELAAAHGKAEAWFILSPGDIHLGLTRDFDTAELLDLVARQDTEELLASMHRVPVSRGDRVFVPPGVLHAIGEGILLAEVQEPEDLSILLEWRGFELDGAHDGHLGLGFERALRAVETHRRSTEEIRQLVRRAAAGTTRCLPEEADAFFRLDEVGIARRAELEAGFAVVIVVEGSLHLAGSQESIEAPAGSTLLIPASAGPVALTGKGTVLVARPPAPHP